MPALFGNGGAFTEGVLARHPSFKPDTSVQANVYVETNNPTDGLNAVLGYHRNAATGALTEFGKFATGGTGQLNVPATIGPDDGDQQVEASSDGRFLYAVNQGSGSVASFRIHANGDLSLIGTFPSGGVQPDSIGIAGAHVYVANRGDAGQGNPGTVAPNVTGFDVTDDGSLAAIPGAVVSFPIGTLVTQTLVAKQNRFLFVDVASLSGASQGNTLAPFQILADGTLQLAPGGNAGAGAKAPFLLGAAVNPNLNIIYAGFTSAGQIGVFTFDETGRTNFVGNSTDQGTAPCWCRVSADGKFLYVANTGTDSIGVFSLADPLHPVEIQDVNLAGPRALDNAANSPKTHVFEIAIDPSGRYLFAITQASDPSFPQGNQLHTLRIGRDGTLTEPIGPVIFSTRDVPANAHPQGVAVVIAPKARHHRWFDMFDE